MNAIEAAGYGRPSKNRPQWYVPYLTFKHGMPHTPTTSLTGSGFIYRHDNPGRFQPVIVLHTSPTLSVTGSGFIPKKPGFLTRLFGNPSGNNTVA